MAEICSYCGESGHSIQQCPKWKGKAVATATEEVTPYMQEKIPLIMSKLREAQKTMMVSKATLYEWVSPYVTRAAFDEIIAYLERKGEIFEPRPGFLKTTESSSVDWKAVWQKAMEKLKTDRSKVTDVARAEILSTATMASVPETFRTQIGRDLHIYPKYDAYAMWVNPKGGFLFFATPEEKSKIEHFLFAVGQFLDVIPPGAEFPEEGKKLELTDVTGWSREQIFNYVKNKENWKKPTNPIRVKAGQKEKVSEAICYYVGGVEFKDLKDGTWLITSRGYYYYIGA